jgi:hypothetical protein
VRRCDAWLQPRSVFDYGWRAGAHYAARRRPVQRRPRVQPALEKFQELTVKYYGKPVNFVLHKNSELGLEKDYFAFMNQGISVDYGHRVARAHVDVLEGRRRSSMRQFLFRDLDHWNKVLDADTLKPIADEVSRKATSC